MKRLREELEALDEVIFALEDKIGLTSGAQKVASRLDQAIDHVENILRH